MTATRKTTAKKIAAKKTTAARVRADASQVGAQIGGTATDDGGRPRVDAGGRLVQLDHDPKDAA